jgi:hypothetical protein
MTERSMFWETNDTGDGPAAGYSQQRLYEWLMKVVTPIDETTEGTLKNVENELAVTGTATPLTIAEGAAQVHGFFYENTAPVTKAVASPVIGTTGGRVVLEADWTLQTVRIAVNVSADGVAAIPALTQTPGTTWEISLATFTITTGGVITLTDTRQFARFATRVRTDMIEDSAVTEDKINANAVTTGKIAANAVGNSDLRDSAAYSVIGRSAASGGDPADIAAGGEDYVLRRRSGSLSFGQVFEDSIATGAITNTKLATGAVSALKIADNAVTEGKILAAQVTETKIGTGAVTNAKLGTGAVSALKLATDAVSTVKVQDDAIDDTKVGNRVPQFYRRQGGSATNWATPGTTSRTPGAVRMQAGIVNVTVENGEVFGFTTVTFPVQFADAPIIFATLEGNPGAGGYTLEVQTAASNLCNLVIRRTASGVEITIPVAWLAIGPE